MPKPLVTGTAGLNPFSSTTDGTAYKPLTDRKCNTVKLTATLGSTATPVVFGDPGADTEPGVYLVVHSSVGAGIFVHFGGSTAVGRLCASDETNFIGTAGPTANQVAFYNNSGVLTCAVGSTVDAAETYWYIQRLF